MSYPYNVSIAERLLTDLFKRQINPSLKSVF